MSDVAAEEGNENEGEKEVRVESKDPAVEADKDLGALNYVPTLSAENTDGDEEEAPEPVALEEVEEEEEAEETSEQRAKRKERKKYLRLVEAFYMERGAFFKGKRNATKEGRAKFWRDFKRGKNESKLATFEADGSMRLTNKAGEMIKGFPIEARSYHEPEADIHERIDKQRIRAIKEAETAFEVARTALRSTSGTPSDRKAAQRAVREADEELQMVRYATKGLAFYESLFYSQLLFEEGDAKKKTDAFGFVGTPMTSQQRYAVEDAPGEPKAEGEEKAKKGHVGDLDIILFSMPDGPYDFLSSWYKQKLKYKGIRYNCAFQAIMAEMARKFGDDEKAEEVMAARDPGDMILTFDQFEDAEEADWRRRLESLVMKVNRVKFEKEELRDQLLETGAKYLGCSPPENPTDTFLGIGRGLDEEKAYRRKYWKGKNKYGKALEQIRNELVAIASPKPKKKKAIEEEPSARKPKKEEIEEVTEDMGEAKLTAKEQDELRKALVEADMDKAETILARVRKPAGIAKKSGRSKASAALDATEAYLASLGAPETVVAEATAAKEARLAAAEAAAIPAVVKPKVGLKRIVLAEPPA